MRVPAVLYKKILEVFPRPCVDIVLLRGDKVLLLRRAIEPGKGTWALPGGVVEKGEAQKSAASRKTYEETGLKIVSENFRLVSVVDWFHPERHDICSTYTAIVDTEQNIVMDYQHSLYIWAPADDLPEPTLPIVRQQIKDALKET